MPPLTIRSRSAAECHDHGVTRSRGSDARAWIMACMRVTVVGCAGSFPGPDSPASCYLLEAEGFRLVIDLGNGALGVLQRYAGLFSIDAICLSHLHADHCIDLAAYWVARQYAPDG